ncbi:hypothetical protein ACVWZT_003149 [Pseudomonas sp. TE21394]
MDPLPDAQQLRSEQGAADKVVDAAGGKIIS